MNTLILIILALFGLLLGSFINVVILRMRTGMGLGGRSQCMSCCHVLGWRDLIPVVSYLAQGGRCRYCDAKICWPYWSVELIAALIPVLLFTSHGLTPLFGWMWFISLLLLVLAVYDVRHTILPDGYTWIIALLAGAFLVVGQELFIRIYPLLFDDIIVLDHIAAAALLPLPFFIMWILSSGRLMGLGDIKLMSAIGLVFGFLHGLEVIVAAFWLGGIVGVGILLMRYIHGKKALNTAVHRDILEMREVPFGPFLAVAIFLSFLGIHLFEWLGYFG